MHELIDECVTAYIFARAAERKGAQIITERIQNPMQDEMQDGMLIVPDEGETHMQLITLCLDMSLRSYNLVATNSYSLPSLHDNKMGDDDC